MKVLLTSCGLETPVIERAFLDMLGMPAAQARALFIPTAAIYPDAIEVLPKCLHDLLKVGVPKENITVCDLHDAVAGPLHAGFDVVYLCGGDTAYLLRRLRENGFAGRLRRFIEAGGAVIGTSAGSVVFAGNLPDNLGLVPGVLEVHCADNACDAPGFYPYAAAARIRLGNQQAMRLQAEGFTIIE